MFIIIKQYLEIFKKHFTFKKCYLQNSCSLNCISFPQTVIIMKSLFQQMIEDHSNVLIEQAIVIFQKKLRFKSRKKKNIDILNSSLYFRKQNMKLWTNEILTQYLKSSRLFFSWNQKFTKKLESAELFWII